MEATPACSQPIAVSASNINTNSADISFTDVTNSTYGYIAVYTDGTSSDTLYPSTPSFSLSGLSANTVYTVSLRTICDIAPNADTSDVATLSLITNCADLSSFPYIENFTPTNASLRCWTSVNGGSATQFWRPVTNSGGYLWIPGEAGTHSDHYISPQWTVVDGSSDRIAFDGYMDGASASTGSVYALVSTSGTSISSFTDTLNSNSAISLDASITRFEFDLSAYESQSINIASS